MTFSLAAEPMVALGPLRLSPPTREIVDARGQCHVVEPRVMQVLLVLIRAEGAIVSRDALNASCWDGRIVGEDAINRVISRIRRLEIELDRVFQIETITRVGYRLVMLPRETSPAGEDPAVGKGPAAGEMGPAPRGEDALTPPAGAPDRPARDIAAAAPARRRIALWGLIGALAGFALVLVVWRATHIARVIAPSRTATPAASARAPGPEPRPLARPVPQLQIAALTLLSPTLPRSLPTMAREEIVAAFGRTSLVQIRTDTARVATDRLLWRLTGSIDRVGAQLRFILHLTRPTSGKIIWSAAIDRPAANPGTAAKSVAAAVEQVLDGGLVAAAGYRGGRLPDATLALLLQFNQDTTLPAGPYRHAEEVLRRAIAQTPDFGAAWSNLALALGYTAMASEDPAAMRAARAAAPAVIATALAYQPGDAIALLGRAKTLPLTDFRGRDAAYRRATQAPTSILGSEHSSYSAFLIETGQIAAAVREAKIAYDLDPLNSLIMARYAHALSLSGRSDAADRIMDDAVLLWPGDGPTLALQARSALWTGRFDRGRAAIAADPQLRPATRAAMRAAFGALQSRDTRQLDEVARMLVRMSDSGETNSAFVVSALGALGQPGDALAAAGRLIAQRNLAAAAILFDPTMAAARELPAFGELVSRIGLRDYWRSSATVPDFCSAGGGCAALLRAPRVSGVRKAPRRRAPDGDSARARA